MSERLSVAIPFYRRPDYLALAVDSALARPEVFELLVVDDGGEEQGVETLLAARADPRVRYLRNPGNLGMVATWNVCLDQSRGELVTLLHADDLLADAYAPLMLGLAAKHPNAVAFCCDARIIDASGRDAFSLADSVKRGFRRGPEPLGVAGESGLRAVMTANFIMCPTLCYRRAVLGARRFEARWKQVQDLELTSRLLLEDETIVSSRARAYLYRRHAEGATAVQSESRLRFDEEFELFEQVAAAAESRGWPAAARAARSKRIVKLHLLYRAARELGSLHPARAREWLRYLREQR